VLPNNSDRSGVFEVGVEVIADFQLPIADLMAPPGQLTLGGSRVAVTNIARKGAEWCITWNICFWSASFPSEPTCCPG
jgi:hypothetical protein